jgi:hypothetical protein
MVAEQTPLSSIRINGYPIIYLIEDEAFVDLAPSTGTVRIWQLN